MVSYSSSGRTRVELSFSTRLQSQALAKGVELHRASIEGIQDLINAHPGATAYFNCTGLGSLSLKGVEDHLMYPTRVSTYVFKRSYC